MTFVPYPDIVTSSDNGKYRLEIIGNSEAEGLSFRDQSNFVYRLTETSSGRTLWTWKSADGKGLSDYPHDGWVSDQGHVVVRLHTWFQAGILVLSPTGKQLLNRTLKSYRDCSEEEQGILQDESEEHIGGTSAGPSWQASSIPIFHTFNSEHYWSILTWWGRRIVINLESGSVIENVSADQLAVIEETEKAWILSKLQHAEKLHAPPEPDERWNTLFFHCDTAAYHAGCLKISEAKEWLQILESSNFTGGKGSRGWFYIESFPLRSIAKISLLKLGFEPQWYADMIITDKESKERCEYPEQATSRDESKFKTDMSQRELLKEFGVPEYLRTYWDYSFGSPTSPYTIRIHWHDKHKVDYDGNEPFPSEKFAEYRKKIREDPPIIERIEKIELPIWKADSIREYVTAHIH